MTAIHDVAKPEFSRTVPVERLRRGDLRETIEAGEGERKALAARFELEAIDRLTAQVLLEPMKNGTVRVSGHLDAAVVQTCVVSLEPVPATVSESFAALFAPPEMLGEEEHEMEIDIDALIDDEEDLPEPIIDNRIDIGELVAQHLSLALAPYPRAPGIGFDDIREHEDPTDGVDILVDAEGAGALGTEALHDGDGASGPSGRPNPFAVLEKLKKN